jgi:iron only hydrogenase large subunit-like protein
MNDSNTLIELINKKEKLVAMLAPSFPIVFSYPTIITMLRNLGFSYVVEVAAGAKTTNAQLLTLLQNNPHARYITSPCPTVVRMIKKAMPQYAKYLTHNVDSPMVATAEIVREKYPGYKSVFIGPCVMKKLEAKEDASDLNILVITYVELQEVFNYFDITEDTNTNDHFDIDAYGKTKMYAVDGGLTQSSGLTEKLNPEEIKIVSGLNNRKTIQDFDTNQTIKILDILNCPGGCIFGPGIRSTLTLEQRKQKIITYAST